MSPVQRRCHMCGGTVPDSQGQLEGCPTMCAECQHLYIAGAYRRNWSIRQYVLEFLVTAAIILLLATMLGAGVYFMGRYL